MPATSPRIIEMLSVGAAAFRDRYPNFLGLAIGLASLISVPNAMAAKPEESLPAVEWLASGVIDGTAIDCSALVGELEDQTPVNRAGGFSAIEYSGKGDHYWLLADRGPADGATNFACRLHEIELKIDKANAKIDSKILKTVLLQSEERLTLLGSLAALSDKRQRGLALDPEGLRLDTNGCFLISDEYGPGIYLFSPDGIRRRSWALPKWMRLTRESDLSIAKMGTMPNRGLEGLAISSDGKSLIAAMQGPLIQDSEPRGSKRFANHVRLIQFFFDESKPTRHFLYPLADETTGISEILAFADDQYLVIERDGELRSAAKYKAIYWIDLALATDVADHKRLPAQRLPTSVRCAEKRVVIDLLDDRLRLPRHHNLEKPEGLAWGPNRSDGRRTLIVCFDNDFQSDVESLIVAFAVAESEALDSSVR